MRFLHAAATLPLCLLAFAAAGCAAPMTASQFAAATPAFDPPAFFTGPTHSWGMEETGDGVPAEPFHVESVGHTQPDGSFVLDQTLHFGADTRIRRFVLHRVGAQGWEGTLTDAAGPVRGETSGNLFHFTYALKQAPMTTMEQWLYLQPGGHEVLNEDVVRVMGMPIRRVSEVITRDDGMAAN
jgi:hypothetical protein